MARHIRIPLLVDLILTSDPDEIRQLADHTGLDRGFHARGPLVNRLLARRVKSALSLDGTPLPSLRMRDDQERQQVSEKLTAMFAPGQWDAGTLALMVEHVRGGIARPAGELAQQAVGRVFDPKYKSDADTWEAAKSIETHLRTNNPVRRVLRGLTGALRRAQSTLGRAAKDDRGAVHGTGIAVHNLALSLDRMQTLWADETRRARLDPDQAALSVVAAPRTVMRAGAGHSDTIGGRVRPTTLVALNTRPAAGKAMDADLAFLGSSWSRCPTQGWVMALLAEVWRQAGKAS